MSLETLKGLNEIGGYDVDHYFGNLEEAHNSNTAIIIDHTQNAIFIKIQNGPVNEVGINGCQVDTLIETAKIIIEGLNKNLPCRENSVAITKLDEALMWLEKRKKYREKRNVEGFNKE